MLCVNFYLVNFNIQQHEKNPFLSAIWLAHGNALACDLCFKKASIQINEVQKENVSLWQKFKNFFGGQCSNTVQSDIKKENEKLQSKIESITAEINNFMLLLRKCRDIAVEEAIERFQEQI